MSLSATERDLEDLLTDPVARLLMRSDGVTEEEVRSLALAARARLCASLAQAGAGESQDPQRSRVCSGFRRSA